MNGASSPTSSPTDMPAKAFLRSWTDRLAGRLDTRIDTGGLVLLTGQHGGGGRRMIDDAKQRAQPSGTERRHDDLRGASVARVVRSLRSLADRTPGVPVTVWADNLDEALTSLDAHELDALRARTQRSDLTVVGLISDDTMLRDPDAPFFFASEPISITPAAPAPSTDTKDRWADLVASCLGWRPGIVLDALDRPHDAIAHAAASVTEALDGLAAIYDLDAARLGSTAEAIVAALTELARPPSSSNLAWAINRSPSQVSNALRGLTDGGIVSVASVETCVGWQPTNWRLVDPLWAARRGGVLVPEWMAQTALIRTGHALATGQLGPWLERSPAQSQTMLSHLRPLASLIAPMIALDPIAPLQAQQAAEHPDFLPPRGQLDPSEPAALHLQSLPGTPATVLRGADRIAAPWLDELLARALPEATPVARQAAIVITASTSGVISRPRAAQAITAAATIASTAEERDLTDAIYRDLLGMGGSSKRERLMAVAAEVGGSRLATLIRQATVLDYGSTTTPAQS